MTRQSTRTSLSPHGAAVQSLATGWLAAVADAPEVRAAGGDLACSPVGLWLTLTATAAGADGETAAELRDVLGTAGEEAATAVREVAEGLAGTSALSVATGLWSRTPVYRAFREALPRLHFGGLEPEDLSRVDAWVRESTGGLIERLPLRPDDSTLLLLANALALKARWAEPFDAAATRPAPFTDATGRRHEVPTMSKALALGDAWQVPLDGGEEPSGAPARARRFRLPWRRTADGASGGKPAARHGAEARVTVVELGCRTEEEDASPAVVRFLLGPPGAPAARVLPAAWAPGERRAAFDADQITVALPRLSLRTRLEVLPQVRRLGVRRATEDEAEFPGLSAERLKISSVVQECLVKVAEEGVEAAAVTAVAFELAGAALPPSRPLRIAFDRPFGIVVLDGTGTVPLFTAWQATAPQGPEG